MSEQKQGIYEFHNFQLDIGKGLLLRENQPVTLQWKTFELLCLLVESNGNLITRDDLMNKLWAETFVEDNNLSQHIRALRKALGENENNDGKFIETVPGRGYRFLPEVCVVEMPEVIALSSQSHHQTPPLQAVLNKSRSESAAIVQPIALSNVSGNENEAKILAFPASPNAEKIISNDETVEKDTGEPQISRRRRGVRRALKFLLWGFGIGFIFLILLQILQIANMMLFGTPNNLSKEVLKTSLNVVSMLSVPVFAGWLFGIGTFLFGIARLIFALFEKEDSKLNASRFEKMMAIIITALIAAVVIPNLIASYRAANEFRQSEKQNNTNQNR